MDKPIIFADMDGCLASQSKIWKHQKDGALTVLKSISDHDSWCIDHFKQYAHIIIISGDERINRAWAERRGVPFIFTCAGGFHQGKMGFLIDYWNKNFLGEPEGSYYYLGDAMPDYECMVNAKQAFIPDDASEFITHKIKDHNNFTWLNASSGQGCFEAMAWLLVRSGVLPNVQGT